MKTKTILFVDDELQILKSVNRLFMDSSYNVLTADSGEKALGIMSQREVDLIITDMRMPAMDGYALLEKVKEKYPDIIRLILSGYSDESIVFKAIQRNLAKLYIFKPWDNEGLIKTIERVFETERVLTEVKMIDLIKDISVLPTIPDIYEKTNKLIEEDADIKKIADLIETDQSIASKILHIANSAYFGAKTGSVRQAITYIGTMNLKEMILSAGIIEKLSFGTSGNSYSKVLWDHSFICSRIFISLCERIFKKAVPSTSMASGLLHDIGRVVMTKIFNVKYYEAIIRSMNHEIAVLIEEERKNFGFSHQEFGGYLLRWWEFPLPIIEAALYHHDPLNDNIISKDIVAIVHLSDYYSWALLGNKFNNRSLETKVFDYLGISEEECSEFVHSIKDSILSDR